MDIEMIKKRPALSFWVTWMVVALKENSFLQLWGSSTGMFIGMQTLLGLS